MFFYPYFLQFLPEPNYKTPGHFREISRGYCIYQDFTVSSVMVFRASSMDMPLAMASFRAEFTA